MKKLNIRRNLLIVISLFFFLSLSPKNNLFAQEGSPLEGRWDVTLHSVNGGKEFPSWLEVSHSGTHTLVGQYVGAGGSARPISKVNFKDNKMSFTIPPQWDRGDGDFNFEANFQGDSLSGSGVSNDGKNFTWTAHRAPKLKRTKEPVWGEPIQLFNGKDLTGWHAMGNENQWIAQDGIMRSPHSGANLVTDQTFNDFKLHIEFRYPKESNSGVYLRGRYEVQIEDSKGKEATKDYLGAVYGFIAPTEQMAKDPGEWQSYDITLTGRMVTVVANGVTVICNREIPGITGGAINSKEEDPGPLLIQGDHGPIDYRNIVITPAK
jgi:hypothetical protein